MFKQIDGLLTAEELAELNAVADTAHFVDGRISNPHNKSKENLHLHDPAPMQKSAKLMADALYRHEDFRNWTFPKVVAPPLITKYREAMRYGLHSDTAYMQVGGRPLRSDISCTIFLTDPGTYDGGALHVNLGTADLFFRLPAGSAIPYPSTTLHEVTPVTRGERRVGLTFIESHIADPVHRDLLYELNEVSALEGLNMRPENYVRMTRVQQNLLRLWADHA